MLRNSPAMCERNGRPVEKIGARVLAAMPLPAYDSTASKAERGKLLIVAGSSRLPGAALLAALAALRVGCGTVRLAAPERIALALGVAQPELMVIPLPESGDCLDAARARAEIERQYDACQAIVLGPGLEESEACAEVVRAVVACAPRPMVVDAQALYDWHGCEAGARGRFEAGAGPRVFTPHPGELSRILGRPAEDLAAEAESVARGFARERRCVLVMKGAQTLIASPDGRLLRNMAGSRALGTAGSGDTLAGAIGGLLAQGLDATAAAVWGVHLHALCGERAGREIGLDGVLARDLLDRLPLVLRDLRGRTDPRRRPRRQPG